jgi:hypothetical protein
MNIQGVLDKLVEFYGGYGGQKKVAHLLAVEPQTICNIRKGIQKARPALERRARDLLEQKAVDKVAGIFHKNAEIRAEQLNIDSAAFMDFFTMYVQTISILMCGSATALTEGKFGSYAKEESTTVREKSIREQKDIYGVEIIVANLSTNVEKNKDSL